MPKGVGSLFGFRWGMMASVLLFLLRGRVPSVLMRTRMRVGLPEAKRSGLVTSDPNYAPVEGGVHPPGRSDIDARLWQVSSH